MLSSWYHKSLPSMRPNPPIHLLSVSYILHPEAQSLGGTDTFAVALTSRGNLL